MTYQPIKDAATLRPFRPFRIHLTDGRDVVIKTEDEVVIHPKTKRTMIVFMDNGGFQIIDLEHVATLDLI